MMEIYISDVSFSYGTHAVLSRVNLTLSARQPVVLMGSSGQGKTTLLRLLAGLETPTGGQIKGISADTRIAVLFQEDRLFPHLSVYENLKLIRPRLTREDASDMLTRLNLTGEVLDQLPRQLSGGMRRRTALARALLFESELVLLDEPFQGLDEDTHRMALNTIREYTQGRPLLLVSHNPKDGAALGAKIVTL